MKHKTSLLLMEQLVMILVFAVAAALCLQVFVKSRAISEETVRRDTAVVLARNAAELLKATDGNLKAAEAFSRDGYKVTVVSLPASVPGLAQAEIAVTFEEEILFSLETGWQEVLP